MSSLRERVYRGLFDAYKGGISPVLAGLGLGQCRYLPTCSEYAYTAVVRLGLVEGGLLALRRIAKCHPWSKGGLDPVPEEYGCGCRGIHTASAPAIYHTETAANCETHNELHS